MKTFTFERVLEVCRDIKRRRKIIKNLTSRSKALRVVGKVDEQWRLRINDVISSPDNSAIPRCEDAGKLKGYKITMHNGVQVLANGYYGSGILNMLIENKGVHEPQEERVFELIIRLLPEKCVMLELGAYWGFYSLSLLQTRPQAKCYLVEPETENLLSGKINFRLNARKGHFTQAGVGRFVMQNPKTISVDWFCKAHSINHLDILHSDIQGSELAMLEGASETLKAGCVDYIFISTHSNELHANCLGKLESFGYIILCDADMNETYSYDGLIVAKHNSIKNPMKCEISKKAGLARPGA